MCRRQEQRWVGVPSGMGATSRPARVLIATTGSLMPSSFAHESYCRVPRSQGSKVPKHCLILPRAASTSTQVIPPMSMMLPARLTRAYCEPLDTVAWKQPFYMSLAARNPPPTSQHSTLLPTQLVFFLEKWVCMAWFPIRKIT